MKITIKLTGRDAIIKSAQSTRIIRLPKRRPRPGDVYKCVFNIFDGWHKKYYEPGDTIEAIGQTNEAPHGYKCSAGNWKVKTKHGEFVWADFEHLITADHITLASAAPGEGGDHGYDPALKSMGATFIARGPAFKSGLVVEPFLNIHLYELMAAILNLPPAPNDGSLDSVRVILQDN